MDYIRDLFSGPPNESMQTHDVELGGPAIRNTTTSTGSADLNGLNEASGDIASLCDYKYTATIGQQDFQVSFTTRTDLGDRTDQVGFVLATADAYPTFILVFYNPTLGQVQIGDNSGSVTAAYAYTANVPINWLVTFESLTIAGYRCTMYANGVQVLQHSLSTIFATPSFYLRWFAHAGLGTVTFVSNLTVESIPSLPEQATAYLIPKLGVFAQYTPTTTGSLSALRFEYPARAIILKGPLADQAVQWVAENTPPELTFAP